MGTDRSGTYLRGLLVPDPRISFANLVNKTDATVPSSYTEAGPFAGPAKPDQDTDLILRTSGSQTADGDLEVYTQRSGGVGLEAAGFVWRDVAAGDSASQYKGQDAVGLVTDWESLLHTSIAQGADIRPHVIRLASGRLLCSYSVTTLGVVRVSRYDPSTSSWTACNLATTGSGAGYITTAVTICQLSSGRVLAYCLARNQQQVDAYYSDDDGDTWSPGGYRVLGDGVAEATVTDLRAAWSPENSEVLLLAVWSNSTSGVSTVSQFASADLGSTFSKVVDDLQAATSEEEIAGVEIVPMLGGGFCVIYRVVHAIAYDELIRRRIGSAYDPLDGATALSINGGVVAVLDHGCTAWRDEDGVMWAYVADNINTGGGGRKLGAVYRSLDQGGSWEAGSASWGSHSPYTTTTGTRPNAFSAMSLGGRVAFVYRWLANTSTGYEGLSVACLWYAGHSSHTGPAATGLARQDYRDVDYIGWGFDDPNNQKGGIWYPIALPDSVDWTLTGAGTPSWDASGVLQLTTTAGQTLNYSRTWTADGTEEAAFLDFEVELDSGSGSTSSGYVTLDVVLSDGAQAYRVSVHLADTGYAIYDQYGAAYVGSSQTYDLTSKAHIRLAVDVAGYVRSWHCRGGHVREWVPGASASGLTDGGAGVSNLVRWGHTGAHADVSRFSLAGYCYYPGQWQGTDTTTLAASWSNPTDLHPRSFPTAPALLHDGIQVEAVSGPSWYGESQRLTPVYEHPIRAIHPGSSPSPSREWRSAADNVDVAIVWDLEGISGFGKSWWESTSVGCFLVGANFKTFKLQGYNTGTASWDDIITGDATKGYSGINCKRAGRIVWRDTGGGISDPTGERWSPHEMHAGDTIYWVDGETKFLRKVQHNSEGGWRAGTKLAKLHLDPDYLDGTESSSMSIDIWRRNFGAIAHEVTSTYRYVRLFIPQSKTADGYYRIGAMALGPLFPFGLQPGNGWAWEQASNVELTTRDSGVRSARIRGPRRRAIEVSWSTQAQDTTRMWDSEPAPDYVSGSAGGEPVASIADTVYQVLGLTERTDGPSVPVVYLSRVGRGTGSLAYTLDPEWIYGRITTDTSSLDHVVGDEGVSPVLRGNRVRIEEEV